MLLKQTHFPLGRKENNNDAVVVYSVLCLGCGYLTYMALQKYLFNKNKPKK